MIRLIIDNSFCQITGVNVAQFKELKDLLSYSISASERYYSGNFNTKRYLIDKKGNFPTGLLYLVDEWFKKQASSSLKHDRRTRPEAQEGRFNPILGVTPYSEQIAAAKACKRFSRGIVCAPTGSGKSIIAALIINAVKVPTLIVVPTLELKRQLTESLTAIYPNDMGLIAVENIDALSTKDDFSRYQCVIIDEFHHAAAKSYRALNKKAWKHIYYRFGLTATPFRSQDHERLLLESVLSQVIYKIDYTTAVEKGYVVPVEAYYIEVPLSKVNGSNWASVYSELVVNNKERNRIISLLLQTLNNTGVSTLCLVKEIKHGEQLQALTGAGFANGESEDCQQLIGWFNEGKLKTLIGTAGVCGEGVDTRPAEYVIITGLGKSKNAFMQAVGRSMRRHGDKSSGKVIIFLDKSHKWSKAHFAAQRKILLDEYGIKPIKLELG